MEAVATYPPNHTILILTAVGNANITHRFTALESGDGTSQRAVRAEE